MEWLGVHKQGAKCVFRVDFLRGEELQYFLRMPKLWCLRSDQGPFCKTGKGGQMTSEGLHSQLAVKLRRETASHAAKSATWSALPLHSTALPLALSVDRSPNHKVKIWHEIWSLRAFRLISYCTGIQQAFSVTNKKKKSSILSNASCRYGCNSRWEVLFCLVSQCKFSRKESDGQSYANQMDHLLFRAKKKSLIFVVKHKHSRNKIISPCSQPGQPWVPSWESKSDKLSREA